MCSAANTINQRISDTLTDVLQALFQSEPSHESKSTESFIHKIDMLNQKIKSGEIKAPRLMVGSLDVEALYPSTDVHQASKIVKDRILKSPLKFENIDYRWALIYVALTQTPEEQSKSDIQA